MFRVIIIGNNSGGLYDFRHELIEELVEKGCEVTALTPFDTKVDELRALNIKLIETKLSRRGLNPITDFKLYCTYKRLIKHEKPDLVISYTIKPNVYGGFACRMLKIPYAVNITGLGTAFESGGLLKKIVSLMYKVSCKRAKVVFFENEANLQMFVNERIVNEAQTHRLLGAGVNLERYQVSEYPQGEKIKFLFIGRIMAEKGINELFVAMQKLLADGVSCELDVLGGYEENYKDEIDKYEKAGWLHYHGYQTDVCPFINDSHCFVLPSWHEGMANTNLECAASGRPVITCNIPGCNEAVVEGISGLLCERKNADDLARVMKEFSELPYEERRMMGLAGRKHMEDVFDKKKVVEETINYLMA